MAGGPSIVVRVLGDLTGLNRAFTSSATKAESTSKQIHASFTSMFGALNATGVLGPMGDVFNQLDQGFSQVEEHGRKLTSVLMGVGVAGAAVGAELTSLGSADQAAQQQLAQAIANTGAAWSDYQGQVEEAIKSQERFGHTAVDTQTALATLTEATNDPTKALELMGLTANLATVKHESLAAASTQLARAVNGSTRILKQFGIEVPKVGTAVGDFATQADQANYIIDQLSRKLRGQAPAASDTFMGHVHGLTAAIEDSAAAFGQRFGPAITAAGTAITAIGAVAQIYTAITRVSTAATETQTAATEAQTVATGIQTDALYAEGTAATFSLGAIGILAAASFAASYEITQHWQAVLDFFKNHWFLLAGFMAGPFGLAVAAIIEYRDQIWDAFKAVYHWFDTKWQDLEGTITHPFTKAAADLGAGILSFGAIPAAKWAGGEIAHLLPHHAAAPPAGHAAATTGAVVHIEHAQFNNPVDVDVLSKRLSFALSAGMPV